MNSDRARATAVLVTATLVIFLLGLVAVVGVGRSL